MHLVQALVVNGRLSCTSDERVAAHDTLHCLGQQMIGVATLGEGCSAATCGRPSPEAQIPSPSSILLGSASTAMESLAPRRTMRPAMPGWFPLQVRLSFDAFSKTQSNWPLASTQRSSPWPTRPAVEGPFWRPLVASPESLRQWRRPKAISSITQALESGPFLKEPHRTRQGGCNRNVDIWTVVIPGGEVDVVRRQSWGF